MSVFDQFRLDDRIAVVTGGAQGLGKSIAVAFCEAGATTIVTSRDLARAEMAARDISEESGGNCIGVAADLTNPDAVDELVRTAHRQSDRIDVWVNNAGMNIRHPIEEFPVDEFDRIVDINLRAVWLCCRAVGRIMRKQQSGSVINLASVLGHIGLAERTAYCSTKFGVIGLTQTLALEWAPVGVRCNALCPGPFLTEINHALLDDPAKVQAVVGQTALNRWAELDEIRGPALFLASQASSYMTGASLVVDGGWSAA